MNLTSKEIKVICMALEGFIEDTIITSKDQSIPFNPEARASMKEMIDTAIKVLAKIHLATGATLMDPYKKGDEKEFFTKES